MGFSILPRTKPTFGEQFASGFRKGSEMLDKYSQLAEESKFKQREKAAEAQRKLAQFQGIQKSPFWEALSDDEKGVLEAEATGLISGGTGKALINRLREAQGRDWLSSLGKGEGERQPSQEESSSENELFPQFSDADLIKASAMGGPEGKWAEQTLKARQTEKKAQTEAENTSQQKRQFEHTATKEYAKGLSEAANQAREMKIAITEAKKSLKKGKTGLKPRNIIFKYLSSKRSPLAGFFQDKDTQSIVNAQKTMAGGLKNIFGARPTEREFFWYENILPDLLKSPEVNEVSMNYFEKVADLNLKAQELSDEIVKKNGGYRPIDLEEKVREQLRPEIDKLMNEGYNLTPYVIMTDETGVWRQVPRNEEEYWLKQGKKRVE